MITFKTNIDSFRFYFKGKAHRFFGKKFETDCKETIEYLRTLANDVQEIVSEKPKKKVDKKKEVKS